MAKVIQDNGGLSNYEDTLWKMIAYASRYGHADMLAIMGDVSAYRLARFNEAVHELVSSENKSGRGAINALAEGG